MDDPDFIPYLLKFSFICLTETHVEYFENSNFCDYDSYISPAYKLSFKGRRSGGVICLVKKYLSNYIDAVNNELDNTLVFRINSQLLNTDSDVTLVCTYVPPTGSPFYSNRESDDGVEVLDRYLSTVTCDATDFPLILCGDFNARTGNLNVNSQWDIHDMLSDQFEQRPSQDPNFNPFGNSLLSLCSTHDLTILNGSVKGDYTGKFTYVSPHGNSVIDYIIVSQNLRSFCESLHVQPSVLSPHMCVELCLKSDKCRLHEDRANVLVTKQLKPSWSEENTSLFLRNLLSSLQSSFTLNNGGNDTDVDDYTDALTHSIVQPCEFMIKSFTCVQKCVQTNKWYDRDCLLFKKNLRRLLHRYSRSLNENHKQVYFDARKQYKKLVREKKGNYRSKVICVLENSLKTPDLFWKQIREISGNKRKHNNIGNDAWYQHFKSVFNPNLDTTDNCIFESSKSYVNTEDEDELVSEITDDEIILSISKLKKGRSAGADGIVGEMLKAGAHYLVPYLQKLFNKIFISGTFPTSWTRSTIVPIYKSGNLNDPDNYRGIAITSVLSKVFMSILTNRLRDWADDQGHIHEEQSGFRRGHSTIDNIFILHSVIEHHLLRRKKLYVAFIDFKKAFDSVSRSSLKEVLREFNIPVKMAHMIESVYKSVIYCVKGSNGCTDYFDTKRGLKQGCNMSPQLFLYVASCITREVLMKGKHGIQLLPNGPCLYILLFADDIVLFSDTVTGLQNQLNVLDKSAAPFGLSVNIAKSNVMVFRKGGHLAKHEQWYIQGQKLQVCNEYKYLGLYFSTKLSTNVSQNDLVRRAKVAINQILKSMLKINDVQRKVILRLFDSQIQPLLLYGSEVWGVNDCETVEAAHLFMLKRILNVSNRTPNTLVYGELGRYPMHIIATVKAVKYWLKLLKMPSHRYPRMAYDMMISKDQNLQNWASKIKNVLYTCGYEEAWLSQNVSDEGQLVCTLRQKLIDRFNQQWEERLTNNRFTTYLLFKKARYFEPYLDILDKQIFRESLTRFRFGISVIKLHKLRYSQTDSNLLCPMCIEEDEDEIHFLLHCPVYNDLRKKYILPNDVPPNNDTFVQLMNDSNSQNIWSLSLYIHHALKRRMNAEADVDIV